MGLEQRIAPAVFSKLKSTLRSADTMVRRGHVTAATHHVVNAIVLAQHEKVSPTFVIASIAGIERQCGATPSMRLGLCDLYEALKFAKNYATAGHENGMETHLLRARGISAALDVALPEELYEEIRNCFSRSPVKCANDEFPLYFGASAGELRRARTRPPVAPTLRY